MVFSAFWIVLVVLVVLNQKNGLKSCFNDYLVFIERLLKMVILVIQWRWIVIGDESDKQGIIY